MKTLAGLIWGVVAGYFVAVAIIVVTAVLDAGAEQLGFTKYTFWYYTSSLCVCIALLIVSKPAREQWRWIMLFFVAFAMVLGIGFQAFNDSPTGTGQLAQASENLTQMAMVVATAFMYVVPGLVMAMYLTLAYEGVSKARKVEGSTNEK